MNPTRMIHESLRMRHASNEDGGGNEWVYADELSLTTGYIFLWDRMRQQERDSFNDYLWDTGYSPVDVLMQARRIDAYALNTWPSKKLLRIAYEIKTSRTDLLRELNDPGKRQAALALSNQFFFVVDDYVKFLADEIPEEVGLLRWSPTTGLRVVKEPPYRKVPDPPLAFMVSLARAAQKSALPTHEAVLGPDRDELVQGRIMAQHLEDTK